MSYYYARIIDADMATVDERVRSALKEQGFGVLTEIDVTGTLKKKLDVDFRPYRILGACNPHFAHKALQAEDKIGTMLPCNVILQETADGHTEVAAVDPIASMQAGGNEALGAIASEVQKSLRRVVESL
ncbi:MAG: DUF302 domain-containing protein [Rhodothermales bacterium]|nr:DUF302 domain-containing protein [Rhodothermales bacterium]